VDEFIRFLQRRCPPLIAKQGDVEFGYRETIGVGKLLTALEEKRSAAGDPWKELAIGQTIDRIRAAMDGGFQ